MKQCKRCEKRVQTHGYCRTHYNQSLQETRAAGKQMHLSSIGERLVMQTTIPGWGCK